MPSTQTGLRSQPQPPWAAHSGPHHQHTNLQTQGHLWHDSNFLLCHTKQEIQHTSGRQSKETTCISPDMELHIPAPNTKLPERSFLRLGRCITCVSGKLQSSSHQAWSSSEGALHSPSRRTTLTEAAWSPQAEHTCSHMCMDTQPKHSQAPALSCHFQNNSNSCEVSL